MLITNINPNKANLNNFKFINRIYACGKLYKTLGYDLLCISEDLYNKIELLRANKDVHSVDLDEKAMLNDGSLIDVTLILWREKEYNNIIGCAVEINDTETIRKAKELQSKQSLGITIE